MAKIQNSKMEGKLGFFEVFSRGDVGFRGENEVWGVRLQGLGGIGKVKTFEND